MNIAIDVNEINALRARLNEIDKIPFEDITWVKGDKPILFSPDALEEWRFTGLSNSMFPEYGLEGK